MRNNAQRCLETPSCLLPDVMLFFLKPKVPKYQISECHVSYATLLLIPVPNLILQELKCIIVITAVARGVLDHGLQQLKAHTLVDPETSNHCQHEDVHVHLSGLVDAMLEKGRPHAFALVLGVHRKEVEDC